MKALSIRQPFAWLIVNGFKDIENREWSTRGRGRIYVHAGKKLDKLAIEYINAEYPDITLPSVFDLGGIVGSVVITGCVTESNSRWFYGKHGFILARPQTLPFMPYKGQLGFFEVKEQATATTSAQRETTA